MVDLNAILVPVSILSAGAAAVAVLGAYRMKLHVRRNELKRAQKALLDFYDASDRVMDDPAVPLRVRETVAKLACVIGDRSAAFSFACWLSGKGGTSRPGSLPDEERSGMKDDFAQLNEAQTEDVTRAVIAGVFVLLYRWPEAAKIAREIIVPPTLNKQEKIDLVARARAALKRDNDRDHMPLGGFAAA